MNKSAVQRGYTLIEALIAVGLLAGLAGALGPAIYGGLRVSAAIVKDGERRESLRILDEALTQIVANSVQLSGGDDRLQIQGDKKSLQLPSLAGAASIARLFTLRIEDGRLFGDIAPLLDDVSPAQSTVLFPSGVKKFSYYGRITPEAPLAWRDNWASAAAPLLIRVQLTNAQPGGAPLNFDYRPAGRSFLHCSFDPVSRRCRN